MNESLDHLNSSLLPLFRLYLYYSYSLFHHPSLHHQYSLPCKNGKKECERVDFAINQWRPIKVTGAVDIDGLLLHHPSMCMFLLFNLFSSINLFKCEPDSKGVVSLK